MIIDRGKTKCIAPPSQAFANLRSASDNHFHRSERLWFESALANSPVKQKAAADTRLVKLKRGVSQLVDG
jgi:hypothetical protein